MVNKKGLTLDLNQTLLNLFFLFSLLYLNLGSWFLKRILLFRNHLICNPSP
jgi:hypothetical protein